MDLFLRSMASSCQKKQICYTTKHDPARYSFLDILHFHSLLSSLLLLPPFLLLPFFFFILCFLPFLFCCFHFSLLYFFGCLSFLLFPLLFKFPASSHPLHTHCSNGFVLWLPVYFFFKSTHIPKTWTPRVNYSGQYFALVAQWEIISVTSTYNNPSSRL